MILVITKKQILKGIFLIFALVISFKFFSFIGNRAAIMTSSNNMQKCYVAIVIDDFGYNGEGTEEMLKLDIPFTAAIMPFSEYSEENVKAIENAQKESIIHIPMESLTGKKSWVGDKGIFKSMSDDEIKARIKEAFEIVPNAVGINNHMGSAIMEDERCFSAVMDCIKEKEMFFVDSVTTAKSVAPEICKSKGVTILKRDVFLDSTKDINVVKNNLKKTADIALEKGYALAIGHVGPEGGNITVEAIKELAPQLESQGIEFVTASELKTILDSK